MRVIAIGVLTKFAISCDYHMITIQLRRLYFNNEVSYINFEDAKVIVLCNNFFESKFGESVEIVYKNKACNDYLSYNTQKIWHNIINS